MNNLQSLFGTKQMTAALLLVVIVALTSCRRAQETTGAQRLASCSMEGSPFKAAEFDAWKDTYHETVRKVLAADANTMEKVQCAESDQNLPGATKELKDLASKLPPWQSATRLRLLSQSDLSAVLVEYLRVYECSMLEYRSFLPVQASREGVETLGAYEDLRRRRQEVIRNELSVSREALNRTLAMMGRMNRLRPIFSDVHCFVGLSLDLRNQLGLVAEISSCLPRIQDARGNLRDIHPISSASSAAAR